MRGIVSSLTAPDRPHPVTASCGFSRCDGTADGPDTRGAGSSVERSSLFCACRIPGTATRNSMRPSASAAAEHARADTYKALETVLERIGA